MAFFLVVSMYAVYTGLQSTGIFDEQNSTTSDTAEDDSKTGAKASDSKNAKVKKTVKTAPAITAKAKRLFLKNTIAAITKVKKRLDAQYNMVYELSLKKKLTAQEQATIEKLKKSYKVDGIPCLLNRMKTHPVSIVIAQAALETGWGSSRFYREANNIFGIWSYNKNEPRIAAGVQRDGEKTIYVKKYKNLEASIEGYYRMMARGRAYNQFREARLHTDNPFEIIPYLDHYSELRHEYVKRLYYVIKSNKFYLLDDPQYLPPGWSNIKPADPKYLIAIKKKSAAELAEKCKKDNNRTIEAIPASDKNSSRAIDITALPKTTENYATLAHVTELPHTHEDEQELNATKDQNSSKQKPIKVHDVNTAGV